MSPLPPAGRLSNSMMPVPSTVPSAGCAFAVGELSSGSAAAPSRLARIAPAERSVCVDVQASRLPEIAGSALTPLCAPDPYAYCGVYCVRVNGTVEMSVSVSAETVPTCTCWNGSPVSTSFPSAEIAGADCGFADCSIPLKRSVSVPDGSDASTIRVAPASRSNTSLPPSAEMLGCVSSATVLIDAGNVTRVPVLALNMKMSTPVLVNGVWPSATPKMSARAVAGAADRRTSEAATRTRMKRSLWAPPPPSQLIGSSGCARASGAGVEAAAGLFHALAVRQRPRAERLQRRGHRGAERRQRVLDARRHLGVDAAYDQAVALHRAQRLGQHLLRDRSEILEQLVIAARPVAQGEQDVDAPLRGQEPDRIADQPRRARALGDAAGMDRLNSGR